MPAFPQNGSAATVALLDHIPPVQEAPARVQVEWDSVVLVTRDSRGSERLVEGLRLVLDHRGIGIQRGDRSLVHRLGWDEVVTFRAHPPAGGLDRGVILDIEAEFKVHRFVLTSESVVAWVLDALAVVVRRHYPGGASGITVPAIPVEQAAPALHDPGELGSVGASVPDLEPGSGAGTTEVPGLSRPRGWARRPLRLRRRPPVAGDETPVGAEEPGQPSEEWAADGAEQVDAPIPLRRPVPVEAGGEQRRSTALRPLLFLLVGLLVVVAALAFAQVEGFVHVLPHSLGAVGSYRHFTLLR